MINIVFFSYLCQTSIEALPPVYAWTPEWNYRMKNMDVVSLLNYKNSYILSLRRLLGHDPEDTLSEGIAGNFSAIAYERILGKAFQEVCIM